MHVRSQLIVFSRVSEGKSSLRQTREEKEEEEEKAASVNKKSK